MWSPITYDSFVSKNGNGLDNLDLESGVFTSSTEGYYTITFSYSVGVGPTELVYIYLYHNGNQVKESMWQVDLASMATNTGGQFWIQGSRTVVSIAFFKFSILSSIADSLPVCWRHSRC